MTLKLIKIEEIENNQNLDEIANFIKNDWKTASVHALAYLDPMLTLKSINDDYYQDDGKSIVRYFLANARGYRGENAKIVKKQLNKLLDN